MGEVYYTTYGGGGGDGNGGISLAERLIEQWTISFYYLNTTAA